MSKTVANDKAINVANDALAQLSEALKAGKSETLTNYLAFMARFHRYSWLNTLLILFQTEGTATQVAGFNRWKEMGRYVKKGEKGISILVPIKYKSKPTQSNQDRQGEEDEKETLVGFTTGYVFDVAQTDGEPIPEFATVKGDPGCYTALLRDLILEKGITLEYEESLGGAKGVSAGGRIAVLRGLTRAEEFQVLAHELGHEMLHRGERRAETTVQIRELEAEAVAFVCCTAIGLDTSSASQDYIALYQGDEKLLSQSLSHIQRVSTEILDFLF